MKEPREALLIALKKLEVPVNRGAPRQPVDRFPEGRLTKISMDRPRLALMTHQDWQEFERKRGGSLWQEYGLVYTSSVGTALDARNLKQEFKRRHTCAGFAEPLRFYDTRNAAASLHVADGFPITAASVMLGHVVASTILNFYAFVLPRADCLTAEAMERLPG